MTAIGFGTLAVVFPILTISKDEMNLDAWVVEGYYAFFCLFFLGIMIGQRHIKEYCAFTESTVLKSLFYIFCASLAFARLDIWICWVVGCVFAVGAGLNFIRCCGGSPAPGAAAK